MPHLTFTPLSRKRYRVNNSGEAKPPIIKQKQIRSYTNNFYGRQRRAAQAAAPVLRRVRPHRGYSECPHCYHSFNTGNMAKEVKCPSCSNRFMLLSSGW